MQAEQFRSEDEIYDLLKHIYVSKGYEGFRDFYDQLIKSLIKMDDPNFADRYLSAERAFSSVICDHILYSEQHPLGN